jgi:hypothetical protein
MPDIMRQISLWCSFCGGNPPADARGLELSPRPGRSNNHRALIDGYRTDGPGTIMHLINAYE